MWSLYLLSSVFLEFQNKQLRISPPPQNKQTNKQNNTNLSGAHSKCLICDAFFFSLCSSFQQLNSFGNYQFLFQDLAITTVIGMTSKSISHPRYEENAFHVFFTSLEMCSPKYRKKGKRLHRELDIQNIREDILLGKRKL